MKIDYNKIEQEKEITFFVKKISKKFPAAEVFLVGGTVRDILLKQTSQMDYDFLIRKIKAKELENFLNKLGKVNLVGKQFGVFKFLPNALTKKQKDFWDIALPRTEYSGNSGARTDFNIQSNPELSLKEDLSRRDFTINAMAIKLEIQDSKLKIKKIIDFFDGQKDLRKKIIQTVGNPTQRFKEDYSRMLRGIRFACQFNFQIEQKTWQTIKKLMPRINDVLNGERSVPYETIAKEFLKSFYHSALRAIDLCDQSGIFKYLIPEILKMKKCPQPKKYHMEGDVWTHTRLALSNLYSKKFQKQFGKEKNSIELIIATLFHDIGKPYTIKTPQKDGVDRVRFNGHDCVGAELFEKISQRCKFSSVSNLKFNASLTKWLIENHMIMLNEKIEKMKNRTIEKYFFNEKYSGQDLLKLDFVDAYASLPQKGKVSLQNFHKMQLRIKDLEKLNKEKNRLPQSILNGDEIMKKFNLNSGPQIGKLLETLREAQLGRMVKTKSEAIKFLKTNLNI
ncbi:MAG: HD domain-containing protein [Patescibacteria group bacterium]